MSFVFFFQAEDGIRDSATSRGLGDVYKRQVGDLVNYLQWMGEPAQAARKNIGIGVLIFLGIFIVIAWKLNAAFWKDVK